ncbi:hypothetical protein CEXT_483931 [Caerostris extrusa]|uniref:Uncharacterized protein n=1 Tax=Caerostris extrusa TaxID=172846 RepID=A0AAV4QZW9_CAEEX|nr:hypothetical protein CEXT_483931 [Caerostris extrusa]
MLRFWARIRGPQRRDQRPEDIEMQECLISETVRSFLNFCSKSRSQVVPNEEELHPEPPHHGPRVDLLMEQPGDELQPRQPELEQPSIAEQQSPTNPILSTTQSSSMEQLSGRRYFSRYGNVPMRF